MSADSSMDPVDIDIEAWRQEIKVFAEETQHILNSIGDMLISARQDSGPTQKKEGLGEEQPEPSDTGSCVDPSGGGRLDQLRAKLAQKISEKNN